MSNIRATLSVEQLEEIQGRNESNDVLTLLCEVRRLREIPGTANQLDRNPGPRVGLAGLIRAGLRVQLDCEPCFIAMLLPPS